MKLLRDLLAMLFDPKIPLLFKGLIALLLLVPVLLIGAGLRKAARFLANQLRWQRRARRHHWALMGTNNFGGTLSGGQTWATHAQGGDDRPNWLRWEAANLAVAPAMRIHLIARQRFQRERDRIRADARRAAAKPEAGAWGDSLLAKVGVGLLVTAAVAALDGDFSDLGSGSGSDPGSGSGVPLPLWAKLGLEPWPIGSDDFQSCFVVLAHDAEEAAQMLTINAQGLLLTANQIDPDSLTVDLDQQRLKIQLDPASVNIDRMEHLCLLGIALVEGIRAPSRGG